MVSLEAKVFPDRRDRKVMAVLEAHPAQKVTEERLVYLDTPELPVRNLNLCIFISSADKNF